MASRALIISGKPLATTGSRALAKKPGQVVFPSEKKVSGREIVTAKKAEIVQTSGKSSSKKGSGTKGDTNVSGGRDTSKDGSEVGSEVGSEKPPQKLSTLLVRGDVVASLLGGGTQAEEVVRSNALFQGNKRVQQSGATLSRRESGTGYGSGTSGGGTRRRSTTATTAQEKRVREKLALPASPGGGGKPLALPASPGGGGKPLALPASKKSNIASVSKEAAVDLAQKGEAGLIEAGRMNPVAMVASESLQGAKRNFEQVKELWKRGDYDQAVSLATENPLYFGNQVARVQNWLTAKLKKL